MSSLRNLPPAFALGAGSRPGPEERGPLLWRSLEELADREAFRLWLREQHPQLADALNHERREFLKILGASMALAGIGACSHPPQQQIVPYVHSPLSQVDGLPRFFATALLRDGYAHGVLVENHMGRPTKIEGNPQHPASLGATDIFAQAAVLQLWDPDRSQAVMHRNDVASWNAFAAELLALGARFERTQGAGLHVLTETITSPTLAAQLDAFNRKFPLARWHVCQPAGNEFARSGAQLAFGMPLSTRLHLDRARVILSLDSDFLSDPAAGVRYARDFASGRSPAKPGDAMSRLYVLESTPSITGGMADHRLPLDSAQIGIFVRHLARRLGVPIPTSAELDEQQTDYLDALVGDLQANRGAGLVVVGAAQPPWMHALGHALNATLNNAGATVDYSAPVEKLPDKAGSLADLANAIRAGAVDTLWVLDANPVYDAPGDLQFAAALGQVPHVLHLGLYRDETAALAEWHLPQAHPLEAWSDARAFDGTATIMQPLIAPLYEGRSIHEVLAALLGDPVRDGRALVRRQWQPQLPDDMAWSAALQAGVIPDTTFAPHAASVRTYALSRALPPPPPASNELELVLRPDPTIGTGRWANSGWLQELPKP
ncbi:MAG: TAT-variant-translocated molybdopterin oxidoreductase, partial [Sinobacteraceae bacterium]|nr:TAT-variant-translocated molybdopterin oxidoreductase [Nevskiaceae bacterium]